MKLVIIRHGQSVYNAEKRFTGWTDAPLNERGIMEAKRAGQLLQAHHYTFDTAYTSRLTRAIKTLHLALEEMDMLWLDVVKDYHLNERHYGALQTYLHSEKIAEVGEEQVFTWRRSFDTQPPALEGNDPRHPKNDPRYSHLDEAVLPATESLKDTIARVHPYLNEVIFPQVKEGKKLIISAHGNSIRAMVKILENISEEDIREVNIPTGVPLIYTFDADMNVIGKEFLEE